MDFRCQQCAYPVGTNRRCDECLATLADRDAKIPNPTQHMEAFYAKLQQTGQFGDSYGYDPNQSVQRIEDAIAKLTYLRNATEEEINVRLRQEHIHFKNKHWLIQRLKAFLLPIEVINLECNIKKIATIISI